MNALPAAALLGLALLAGCASRTTERPKDSGRQGIVPTEGRPGLGTAWGEQRESWAEPAFFARVSGDRPAGRDRLYYNDRAGVNAMLDYLGGGSRRSDGLQPAAGGLLRLGIRRGNSQWAECHELRHRRFAVGEPGERYEVVLKNEGPRALEVLVSVDGLDVVDGKTASLGKRGYVLGPSETLAVDGFRTSAATVAAFRFGSMFDSYGRRRHGETNNAGVVGVAVFEEGRRGSGRKSGKPEDHAWRPSATRPHVPGQGYATPPDA